MNITPILKQIINLIDSKYITDNGYIVNTRTVYYTEETLIDLNLVDFEYISFSIRSILSNSLINIYIDGNLLEFLINSKKIESILDFIERKDIEQALFN